MSTRPTVGRPGPWAFPQAERFTLDNGITVLLYRLPGQHVVSLGLHLDLPLTAEDAAREGVAGLTVRCLDEGTQRHPGASFTEALASSGAIMDAHAGNSATLVWLDVAAPRLAPAVELLADAITAPLLSDADVDRHRGLRLAEIEQERVNPRAMAGAALRNALIQPQFRASRAAGGEAATVKKLTGDDVRRFHAEQFGPQGATVVLAGDIDERAVKVVNDALGGWTNATPAASHERPAALPPRTVIVDRPGSVQADVRLGRFTIDRRDPRWPDLQIAAYALGGAFGNRLNRVLREEKGFTYGAGLSTQPLRVGGWTTVQGSFRTEVVAEAVSLMPALLDVTASPLTADEVEDARNYLLDTAPMRYATASGVCNAALGLLAAGLTTDHIDSHRNALTRVTPESATQAAAELLDPRQATLVVVGDRDALAPGLADAGWAEPTP